MTERQPNVWALLGRGAGDNAQVRDLCRRIGGNCKTIQLTFNGLHLLPNGLLGASKASLAPEAAALLQPPWPDMVVAAGRRSAPVARWIRKMSGGTTRLVQIGRPRLPVSVFDLVITTPQYGLPEHPKLVELPLPLGQAAIAETAELETWTRAWASLPRPWVAMMVGAPGRQLAFTPAEQKDTACRATDMVQHFGGALIIMGSPRTGPGVIENIAQAVQAPHMAYSWGRDRPNPYRAALALCDRFIVTSDSASMVSEALGTGRPVSLAMMRDKHPWLRWSARRGLGRMLYEMRLLNPPLTIFRIAERLIRERHVTVLGGEQFETVPFRHDFDAVVARVRGLLEKT